MVVKRINNDELYHHGVKGQRWGHRKQRVLLGRRRGRMTPVSSTSSNTSSRYRKFTPQEARARNRKVTAAATGIIAGGIAGSVAAYNVGSSMYKKFKNKRMTKALVDKGREIFVQSRRVSYAALPKY